MKKVGLYTLGCKVSQYETEAIAELFEKRGYEISDFGGVNDVYVINTCTVTAEADRKSRQMIRRAKKANPNSRVIVLGCYSQRSPEEVAAIEGVDAVIGSGAKMTVPDIAERLLSGEEKIISVSDIDTEPFEPMRITHGARTRVYVKIEDGCESKCAYCAIPSARGKVRSKPPSDVILEVEGLTLSGVPEIVLTGIETGSYGKDLDGGHTLASLISELERRKSAHRIRLGSLAPELIGKDFVDTVRGSSILAPHFHLSLQSGSDKVLRLMRRRYTRERALENLRRLKEAFPGAMFTTDIMVGFPGEEEEDFLDTVRFVREARFLDAHIFAYSERKNTPAASFGGKVPENIKKERSERLSAVAAEVSASVLDEVVLEGKPLLCIFEQKKGGLWLGHSESFIEVSCASDCDMRGREVMLYPERREGKTIFGKIV